MRSFKQGIATFLVVGLGSIAYTQAPARGFTPASTELLIGHEAASAAVQQPAHPKQEERPPKETPEANPPRAEKQEKAQKQDKADKQQQKAAKEQQKNEKKQSKQAKGQNQAAGNHGRIAERDYKAHFGQQHKFSARRVITTTRIVPNQTRFTYVGYTFMFVEPWPVGWGFDDDLYIDYVDDGYFLFDPFHPGFRVALSIVG